MPPTTLIACADLASGRPGRTTVAHRVVHGLVKVPTRGGLRNVKVGPRFVAVALKADRASGCQLAMMRPPPPLNRDLDALVAAVRPAREPDVRRGASGIDLASVLADVVRSAGGHGEIDVVLVGDEVEDYEADTSQLGLLRIATAQSLAAAAARLARERSPAAASALLAFADGDVASSEVSRRDATIAHWERFDTSRYLEANYNASSPADLWLCRALTRAWQTIRTRMGGDLEAIDVGTGPNLYTLLAAVPHVRALHAYEFSGANRAYLLEQRDALAPMWQRWLPSLGPGPPPQPEALQEHLRRKLHVIDGSLYGLSPEVADVATMFFCAECITEQLDMFYVGCERLARGVRPGGALIGAFMLGSDGYETAGVRYPSVPIGERDVRTAFEPYLDLSTVAHVPGGADIREGHEGMLFVFGWRRVPPSRDAESAA